jgi:ATPase family associated with various cellular activities (AAA)
MPTSLLHELKTLISSLHPVATIDSFEEERIEELLRAVAAELRLPLFTWTVTRGLQRIDGQGAIHGTSNPLTLLRHLATLTVEGIFHLKDLQAHLTEPATIRAFKDAALAFSRNRSIIVLAGDAVTLPPDLARLAVPLRLLLPGHGELKQLLHRVLHTLKAKHRFEVTLGPEGLEQVLQALSGMTLNQARQAIAWAVISDGKLSAEDVPALVKRKGEAIQDGGLLEFYPPGENVFELGGFDRLKRWLERARVGFGPEARALGLDPPRGVLIVGVQGCGKSLAAKVIARTWQQPLLKLDAGRLYDKFIGETEKNLRKALDVAEAVAPSVLWIDEIEKGFATGGEADGGVSKRMLGTFLTWMQERRANVFVAATANDLSTLPPELLRKGRFDEIFFVDLPDAAEREAIFRIHLGVRRQDPAALDVATLARVSDGFSGAEIEQAIIASLYRSLHQKTPLTSEIVADELRETVPLSVSRREDIERIRNSARGRFVPVR